jgi:hypothetical protein
MTRDEHLEWCKKRAREYLNRGDITNAIASMGSDLMKHEELKNISAAMMPIGLMFAMNADLPGAKRWIEGFR